jgi:ubiquinone/menaquinone biosynthesis C-methylase UbiE
LEKISRLSAVSKESRVRVNLARLLRTQIRRFGFDVVRWRPRMRRLEENDRFEYQKAFNHFQIEPDSTVLDLGSGDYPFPLATILADLYLDHSPHRTERLVRDHRPLVQLDIHHLPFSGKSVDFIYCSHALEHVDNPLQACSEIMRVGKRGYIETPTLCKDGLFAWSEGISHRWHVIAIGSTIVFFEYSDRLKKGIRSSAWLNLIFADQHHPLQEAFYDNQDFFNTMFMWVDSFRVFVFRLDGTVECNRDPCASDTGIRYSSVLPASVNSLKQ